MVDVMVSDIREMGIARECYLHYQMQHWRENIETQKKNSKEWRTRNKEHLLEYRREHRDESIDYQKKY